MTNLALHAIQPALVAALTADGVLMGMVSGIFDATPQRAALPYVTLEQSSSVDASQPAQTITECVFDLRVWTRGGGRKTALAILNRLYGLLHQGSLNVSGFTVIAIRCSEALTSDDPANDRVEGALRVEIAVSSL